MPRMQLPKLNLADEAITVHLSEEQTFQGVCTIDFETEIRLALLSSSLSFFPTNNTNNIFFLPNEPSVITLDKKLTADLFIADSYNLPLNSISFNEFEWIPFDIDN